MKKLITTLLCLTALTFSVFAIDTPVKVAIDGVSVDTSAFIRNGVTYVPMRSFFQSIGGCTVYWNEATATASIKGDFTASFRIGTMAADSSNGKVQMNAPVLLENGSTLIPLRGIAEIMGMKIKHSTTAGLVELYGDSTSGTYSTDDLYWMSRIIHAESGLEPMMGKIAVGNVVLNRVESANFPNTIYGVIFDREFGVQFTPVANGLIYSQPSAESITAAKRVLIGENVVGNSLYFFNPITSTNQSWIVQNCNFYSRIGNHDFYTFG